MREVTVMIIHIKEAIGGAKQYNCPADIYTEFKDLGNADQESMWLLGVNAKNRQVVKVCISLGGIQTTSVDPRILVKRLIVANAVAAFVVHCHPSGDCAPSGEDFSITKLIIRITSLFDIRLLDHIIICEGKYHSMKEAGNLPPYSQEEWLNELKN